MMISDPKKGGHEAVLQVGVIEAQKRDRSRPHTLASHLARAKAAARPRARAAANESSELAARIRRGSGRTGGAP